MSSSLALFINVSNMVEIISKICVSHCPMWLGLIKHHYLFLKLLVPVNITLFCSKSLSLSSNTNKCFSSLAFLPPIWILNATFQRHAYLFPFSAIILISGSTRFVHTWSTFWVSAEHDYFGFLINIIHSVASFHSYEKQIHQKITICFPIESYNDINMMFIIEHNWLYCTTGVFHKGSTFWLFYDSR